MPSSAYLSLSSVVGLLSMAIQIAACVLLLRERSAATWMMIVGTVISTLGKLGSLTSLVTWWRMTGQGYYTIVYATVSFGSLLFLAGLLLYAMQRRALAHRIAELEAILADQSESP
ncbi:MAG: hypothetical protein ABIS50_01015 [Luteolibacter sp.]|uniref:hypothetical protein n=1 Tax=Luteolibacter sp. TaxID=1962973 RepID=UPI00326725A6